MESVDSVGKIKGAAIRDFIRWYAREHDAAGLHRAAAALPEAERSRFDLEHPDLGVLPSVWYPAAAVHKVLDSITSDLSEAEIGRLAGGAGEATVRGMMTGVQRVIFSRVLTPGAYSKLANLAFKLNYGEGHVENTVLGETCHRGIVTGWRSHHPFLCRMNVAVKRAVYEAMGCRNVRITEERCCDRGDSECGSTIEWD